MNYIRETAAVTFRQPSTANLMVDSADRSSGSFAQFTINRPNSLLNGFFNRIGVTEMVLEWNTPNINDFQGEADITVSVDGAPANPYPVTLPSGFYTVAEAFGELVTQLTAAAIPGATWSFTVTNGQGLFGAGVDFDVADTPLARRMGIYDPAQDGNPARAINVPDLRPVRYLDFVSPQLTYNQDLKDASTALIVRDVLLRWYFAFDGPPEIDADGYPILMGYEPFVLRRLYNPPKQIRWDSLQPVGQLAFEVFTDQGVLAKLAVDSQFLMTLQASEN